MINSLLITFLPIVHYGCLIFESMDVCASADQIALCGTHLLSPTSHSDTFFAAELASNSMK